MLDERRVLLGERFLDQEYVKVSCCRVIYQGFHSCPGFEDVQL